MYVADIFEENQHPRGANPKKKAKAAAISLKMTSELTGLSGNFRRHDATYVR